MHHLSTILSNLQALIAAKAARDRTLTVLLVAVWGRIARMATRLERLVALWRAGQLPKARTARADAAARVRTSPTAARLIFPSAPGWLRRRLGYEAAACGSQLRHLLTDAEARDFLAACPQAGRILRPLLRMLSADPLPEVVRRRPAQVPPVTEATRHLAKAAVAPISQFLDG